MFYSVLSSLARSEFLPLFSLSGFHAVARWDGKVQYTASSLFFLLIITISYLSFQSQNHRAFYTSHSPRRILTYPCTISWYGRISVSGTIPRESFSPP